MSSTLYTNPTINKHLQELQARSVKCKMHIMFNILWSTYLNYTNIYIRSAIRYQPDLNQSENDFRESAIDIGKNLDQFLQQVNLPFRISTRNESVFTNLMASLKQDNSTISNQVASRFNTRVLSAGLLLTLLLEEQVSLIKRYIQTSIQGSKTNIPTIRQELVRNGDNIIKLYLKISKWKGKEIMENGHSLWNKYISDIVDHVNEELRKDYGSSNRVHTRLQAHSLQTADYFYKIIMGTDAYSIMDSACTYNPNVIEFTEESDL